MDHRDILARCDHTLLRQNAAWPEIQALCDDAVAFGCASVCIPPCHVAHAAAYLDGRLPVCTVIGFPNGYATAPVKAFEAAQAVADGAAEIDMVINLTFVADGDYESVEAEIRAVRAVTRGKILKVIIETCLLDEQQKIALCGCVSRAGADYIKTSTGFAGGGATREDVALLRAHVAPGVKVKAAGGIASWEDAADMIALGADRLGTSRLVRLAKG